jgi:hypothetical protein
MWMVARVAFWLTVRRYRVVVRSGSIRLAGISAVGSMPRLEAAS